jgi:hypothetical protein
MKQLWSIAATALVVAGVSSCARDEVPPEPEQLYVSVEVEQHGKTVAAPHLLGFEGRHIIVQKGQEADRPAYRLTLLPQQQAGGFGVKFDVELPDMAHRVGRIALVHGEERRVTLEGDTQLKVMVMRVDSPEFRSLVLRTPGRKAAI